MKSLVALVVLALSFIQARAALACSPARPIHEPTDPARVGLDGAPPVILDITVGDLRRGYYSRTDSCADVGWLWLDIVAEDDQTPPNELRFIVQDLNEDSAFYYPDPVLWVHFNWTDDGEMPIDFNLRIFAVDKGGGQSEPFDIRVRDGEAAGCGLIPARSGDVAGWGVLGLALVGMVRRRARA